MEQGNSSFDMQQENSSSELDRSIAFYMKVEGIFSGSMIVFGALVVISVTVILCCVYRCKKCKKCKKCKNSDLESWEESCCSVFLYNLYKLLYPAFIEKKSEEQKTTFFFGGLKPAKPYMVHTYFLTLMALAFFWFAVVFVDTALYRKSTTCNDINVQKDAYVCFDIDEKNLLGSKPVDCQDVANNYNYNEVHVICYVKYFGFATAASIAFSFVQLILFLIHGTFALTIYCNVTFRDCGRKCILVIYVILCVFAVSVIIVAAVILAKHPHTEENTTFNYFYGLRMPRIFFCVLGIVTIIFVTGFSPYCWLKYPTTSTDM